MTAYAMAHVHSVDFGPDIVEYLQKIDATLDPFGGRFKFHGGKKEVIEGEWTGDLILIEFPSLQAVKDWYKSAAYQEILHLRTDHMVADTLMFEGLPAGYRGADSLEKLLAQPGPQAA